MARNADKWKRYHSVPAIQYQSMRFQTPQDRKRERQKHWILLGFAFFSAHERGKKRALAYTRPPSDRTHAAGFVRSSQSTYEDKNSVSLRSRSLWQEKEPWVASECVCARLTMNSSRDFKTRAWGVVKQSVPDDNDVDNDSEGCLGEEERVSALHS